MHYLFLDPRLSFRRRRVGFLLSSFCNCFLNAYAESSRTIALAISFKSSNKNSMLYHLLHFQMERRDNNKPTFTRYAVILLFYHIFAHINRKFAQYNYIYNLIVYGYYRYLVYYNKVMYILIKLI